ncbi:hypothetical protein N7466_007711 [Penicillium verhagenii]|uniref:uncharacterized protein n=1 Tax=Penicillium verhagenii TaxID=1562060 RepID=UPI002545943C|nr:uncharacterized protein N7466_007711 [Penicillium verhagenii]KAJ5928755.1 hypothetical protein N7466_007711 [Penicillium verhagenii]
MFSLTLILDLYRRFQGMADVSSRLDSMQEALDLRQAWYEFILQEIGTRIPSEKQKLARQTVLSEIRINEEMRNRAANMRETLNTMDMTMRANALRDLRNEYISAWLDEALYVLFPDE